jgi:hypothetical protein
MQIRLYLDEDAMDGNLVWTLRVRGVDVETALDAGLINTPDAKHLEYASLNGRTLYSFNVGHYMALHTNYLSAGQNHAGLILSQQQRYSVGEQMRRLVRLVHMRSAESMRNRVEFLAPGDELVIVNKGLRCAHWLLCRSD